MTASSGIEVGRRAGKARRAANGSNQSPKNCHQFGWIFNLLCSATYVQSYVHKQQSIWEFDLSLKETSLSLGMNAKNGTSKIYGVFGLTLNPIPVHNRGIGDSNGAAKIPLRTFCRFVSSFFTTSPQQTPIDLNRPPSPFKPQNRGEIPFKKITTGCSTYERFRWLKDIIKLEFVTPTVYKT